MVRTIDASELVNNLDCIALLKFIFFVLHRDKSRYNQNWEFYQILTKIRQLNRTGVLDFLTGTPYLNWYFRLMGCKIGKDCCLYPTGGDPFMPEPDLITIGKRCVVDNAAIVAHLNTRGNFELVRIVIEDHVTLRQRARIQQGVRMENGSMLMEKSLVLTGEEVEADTVWQGSPAVRVFMYDAATGLAPSSSFELVDFGNWEFSKLV